MRPLVSDYSAGSEDLKVDWVRMGPYTSTGSFDSRVLDAGSAVDWGALSWSSVTPAGTSAALSVRTGNSPNPDGSWSAWSPVAASGNPIGATSRYLQYRVDMQSSSSSATPELQSVTAAYTSGG